MPEQTFLEKALDSLVAQKGCIKIVQVGAFNGVAGDPIYEWVMANRDFNKILLIEPQKEAFQLLKQHYKWHGHAKALNLAISNNGQKTIRLYAAESRGWGSGSGADIEYRERANRKKGFGLEHFGYFDAPCISLKEAMYQNGFKRADFIQVDCEGYDDEILYSGDFKEHLPKIINYEYILMNERRRGKIENFLKSLGYEIISWNKSDKCAMLRG